MWLNSYQIWFLLVLIDKVAHVATRFKVLASPATCAPSAGWTLHRRTSSWAISVAGEGIGLGDIWLASLANFSLFSFLGVWVGKMGKLELGMSQAVVKGEFWVGLGCFLMIEVWVVSDWPWDAAASMTGIVARATFFAKLVLSLLAKNF